MASALLIPLPISPPLSPPLRPLRSLNAVPVILTRNPRSGVRRTPPPPPKATPLPEPAVLQESLLDLVRASPPTWESAVVNNLLIFVVGSRILLSGLTASGIGVAFLLGTLSWRAFGPSGFLIVAAYFVIVIPKFLTLVFIQNRYLVTTFKVVPRGTEGAVSMEGTVAGLLASVLLASIGYFLGEVHFTFQINSSQYSSQIANFGESLIGATLQEKNSFQWVSFSSIPQLNNDIVNVINISIGSILAILMQQFILGHEQL
ncbi:hypothetical protein BHM03_00016830 [Ensete ventricosum]|nr:hypothetical protein BHM03_00016830 [Ensete ventricosum]